MPVSIRDVAARAGVSQATVSKSLNGKVECEISQDTRERISRIAQEMGYHPRAVARGLAGKRMNTVGIVLAYHLPSLTADPYIGPVLDGIIAVTKARHHKAVLFAEDTWEEACKNLPVYCDGYCDGLILIAPHTDSAIVFMLQSHNVPFVLVGDSRPTPTLSVVDADNKQAGHCAVTYLLRQGHRRIACLQGNAEFLSSHQRLQGYREALEQFHVAYDEALVPAGQYWEIWGYNNTRQLMQMPRDQRSTALFCQDDRIAVGALSALQEMGIAVPSEISVVGASDYAMAATTTPPLTTIRFPLRRIGEAAATMLLEQVHENASCGKHVLLPGELIERASVAPLSA